MLSFIDIVIGEVKSTLLNHTWSIVVDSYLKSRFRSSKRWLRNIQWIEFKAGSVHTKTTVNASTWGNRSYDCDTSIFRNSRIQADETLTIIVESSVLEERRTIWQSVCVCMCACTVLWFSSIQWIKSFV